MQKYAKYVGTATTRRMSRRDWAAVGVADQGDVVFNRANGYVVSTDQFNEAALAKLAEDDGIVLVDDPGDAEEVAQARLRAAQARMTAVAAMGVPQVEGVDVHASTDNEEALASPSTPGATVQSSDAASQP